MGRMMDQALRNGIEKSALTKGQRRKLNALKKSVGEEIGERAFAEWLASQGGAKTEADANAALVVDTLWPSMDVCGRPLWTQAVFGQVSLACGQVLTYVRPHDAA